MTEIFVPITQIDVLKPHPNADKLEIAEVLGWQVCVGVGAFKAGDTVVYVPPDAVLSQDLADRFGVSAYLGSGGKVKRVKLRGEPSFGFVVPLAESGLTFQQIQDIPFAPGSMTKNAAGVLGITKYAPPVNPFTGNAAPDREDFQKYSNIENLRNYPKMFTEGELVSVSEKIHGTNSRVGISNGELLAGSRGRTLKPPQDPDGNALEYSDELYASQTYWFPFSIPGVRKMLTEMSEKTGMPVILYGEVFGPKIQSLHYGITNGLGYAAFDINVGGKFINPDQFTEVCAEYGIPTVPQIARNIHYSIGDIKSLSGGNSMLANHIREGVVVKPMEERTDPKFGRVAMKFISDAYLTDEKVSDSTDI